MTNQVTDIYESMAQRTDGNIYIGVVGPVRTGKSTFIKRFMQTQVLPRMNDDFSRDRAIDELPQSGSGRTIMTAEPKFIPEKAVQLRLPNGAEFGVRLVDCVGYLVPGAMGQFEDLAPRMVMTPWLDHEIPLAEAAEIGTRKVISEHATVGIVITVLWRSRPSAGHHRGGRYHQGGQPAGHPGAAGHRKALCGSGKQRPAR